MHLTYRQKKGAPLTAQELDENFQYFEERLERLERLISFEEEQKDCEEIPAAPAAAPSDTGSQ